MFNASTVPAILAQIEAAGWTPHFTSAIVRGRRVFMCPVSIGAWSAWVHDAATGAAVTYGSAKRAALEGLRLATW